MVHVSHKDKKYDRQLRLWASKGQGALEDAHVLLLGASALATEIAKNLVLPGIGKLTIADDKSVTGGDLTNNFFVEASDLTRSRAEAVAPRLKEMNPDMECNVLVESTATLLTKGSYFFAQYTIIVACDVAPSQLTELSKMLYPTNVPLVVADCVGFYGYLRLSMQEHTIIETHPDSLADMRLGKPFPELLGYAEEFDIESLGDFELAHVPYVVLLLKFQSIWKIEHGGEGPRDSDELRAFKALLEKSKGHADSENFDEAISAAWRLLQKPEVPSNIKNLFESSHSRQLPEYNWGFWILVSALRKYLDLPESENLLPLPGVLPDMKADTKSFVKLQQIYQAKARDDFTRFKSVYRTLLESVGKPADAISDEDGITFCKNARYLTVIRGTPLEFLNDNLPGCKSIMRFSATFVVLTPDEFDDESLLHIYVCIIAAKFYKERHGVQEPSEADLVEEAQRIVKNMKCERVSPVTEDVAKEM